MVGSTNLSKEEQWWHDQQLRLDKLRAEHDTVYQTKLSTLQSLHNDSTYQVKLTELRLKHHLQLPSDLDQDSAYFQQMVAQTATLFHPRLFH